MIIVKTGFFEGCCIHFSFNMRLESLESDMFANPAANIWKTDRRFFVDYFKQRFLKTEMFFAMEHNKPIGELKLTPEGQIISLTVLPQYKNKGIGTALVKEALLEKKSVFVIIESPAGKHIFSKLGFKVYAKRTFKQWRMKK